MSDLINLESAHDPDSEFAIYQPEIMRLRESALALQVEDENDERGMNVAREVRLALRKVRTTIEGRRKEMKEASLRRGQRIDAAARQMMSVIEPLEERMALLEQTAERHKLKLAADLRKVRLERLQPYDPSPIIIQSKFEDLADDEFERLLVDASHAAEARRRQAEEARNEAECARQDAARREAEWRAEHNRLQAEADAAKSALAEKQKADSDALREQIQRERSAHNGSDADRLRSFASSLRELPKPACQTPEGRLAMLDYSDRLTALCHEIVDFAANLTK